MHCSTSFQLVIAAEWHRLLFFSAFCLIASKDACATAVAQASGLYLRRKGTDFSICHQCLLMNNGYFWCWSDGSRQNWLFWQNQHRSNADWRGRKESLFPGNTNPCQSVRIRVYPCSNANRPDRRTFLSLAKPQSPQRFVWNNPRIRQMTRRGTNFLTINLTNMVSKSYFSALKILLIRWIPSKTIFLTRSIPIETAFKRLKWSLFPSNTNPCQAVQICVYPCSIATRPKIGTYFSLAEGQRMQNFIQNRKRIKRITQISMDLWYII